jgi:hypothetical protein
VSTWCHQVVNNLSEIDWLIQPIVAGGLREEAAFQLPSNARLEKVIDLWGTDWPSARIGGRGHRRPDLPARLALALLGWNADPTTLTSELTWCHLHPDRRVTPGPPRLGAALHRHSPGRHACIWGSHTSAL